MTVEEEDDRPRRDITELMPIGLAVVLTCAAVALCFFSFKVTGDHPPVVDQPIHLQPGEVMIGVGAGSTIHTTNPIQDPAPTIKIEKPPAKPHHP